MHRGFRPEQAPAGGGGLPVTTHGHPPALAYRPDIDGLRALAVMAVVLFHAELRVLTGGFVGVDVFFVISGFLISTIVLKEAGARTFSILAFYKRRTLRIFPALFAVIAACFVAGWFLFPPEDYRDLGDSAAAAAAFYSNFYFHENSDYFSADAITMPLLHTWSLAVEEQFYVLAPGLLLLAVRFPRFARAAFLALFAASLAYSALLVKSDPQTAFYMLPSRAFELMTGTALAMGLVPAIRSRALAEAAAMAGLALILFAVLFYTDLTPFPGAAALVPCLGAALIIHSGRHLPTAAGRLLSLPPVVFIGRISYSLYLWHWPVLVFAIFRYGHEIGTPARLGLVAAALALATVSYLLVEQPARHRGARLKATTVLALGALAIAACLGLKSLLRQVEGAPWRLPPAAAAFAAGTPNAVDNRGLCLEGTGSHAKDATDCAIGVPGYPPQFLFFGDSHAQAISMEVAAAARRNGVTGHALLRSACPPVIGLDEEQARSFGKCLPYLGLIEERIALPSLKTVVIASRWASSLTGRAMPNETKQPQRLFAATREESAIEFEKLVTGTVAAIRAQGKHVVLLGPVPELGFNLPSEMTKALMQGKPPEFSLPRKAFDERQKEVMAFLAKLDALEGVDVLYPHELLCDALRCRTMADGKPLYVDDDHLSPAGAAFIAPLIERAIAAR
jgi:peptidoglycan/LPS O-acetylase OafA/YrhL